MLPGLMPIHVFQSAQLSWIDAASSVANSNSFNFGNFDAQDDGLMAVAMLSRGDTARLVTSISIGGANGTLHINSQDGVNNFALASRSVSAGANNITIALSGARGTNGVVAVGAWLLTGLRSTTPVDAKTGSGANVTSQAMSANVAPGGVAIYAIRVTGNVTGSIATNGATDREAFVAQSRTLNFADKVLTPGPFLYAATSSWSGAQTTSWLAASWR